MSGPTTRELLVHGVARAIAVMYIACYPKRFAEIYIHPRTQALLYLLRIEANHNINDPCDCLACTLAPLKVDGPACTSDPRESN